MRRCWRLADDVLPLEAAFRPRAATAPRHRPPGDLVHIDSKKSGRIIGGPGHRDTGTPGHRLTGDRRSRSRGAGWTVIHVAIDDATRVARVARVAYVELLPDECRETASGILRRMDAHFRRLGIPVQRVFTDNGSQHVSGVWKASCADLGVGARRTRSYRPQTNGKVERWFQTVLRECLSLHPLACEEERKFSLDTFVECSNNDRPDLGIKGPTPSPASLPCRQPCETQQLVASLDRRHAPPLQ